MDLIERVEHPTKRHPWELARRDFINTMIPDKLADNPTRCLDVGSGDGWLARQTLEHLTAATEMICYDPNYTSHDICQYAANSDHRIRYTNHMPDSRFGLVTMFDVLEHIEDDTAALSAIADQHLEPDGVVFIVVPAYQKLFTRHDTAVLHHRRYNPKTLRDLIETAGLHIDKQGGMFHSLLAPRLLSKLAQTISRPHQTNNGVGGWNHNDTVTNAIYATLRADISITTKLAATNHQLPGLSRWALCTRQPTRPDA